MILWGDLHMRKIVAASLAGALTLALAACGEEAADDAAADTDATAEAPAADAPMADEAAPADAAAMEEGTDDGTAPTAETDPNSAGNGPRPE